MHLFEIALLFVSAQHGPAHDGSGRRSFNHIVAGKCMRDVSHGQLARGRAGWSVKARNSEDTVMQSTYVERHTPP